jgi:hypothetical protein
MSRGARVVAQALAAYKALGDESGTAVVLSNLAELEFGEGQVEQALRLAGEAMEIHLRGKNASSLAGSYLNIAAYRVAREIWMERVRRLARRCAWRGKYKPHYSSRSHCSISRCSWRCVEK